MIEPKYRSVVLDVHHNNHEEGFSGQFLKSDGEDEGYALTRLLVKK